jgi:hypothetical protein
MAAVLSALARQVRGHAHTHTHTELQASARVTNDECSSVVQAVRALTSTAHGSITLHMKLNDVAVECVHAMRTLLAHNDACESIVTQLDGMLEQLVANDLNRNDTDNLPSSK